MPTVEIAQVPRSQVHQAPQVSGSGAQDSSTSGGAAASAVPGPGGSALPNLGNPVLDVLVMGMHQLQTLQVNQLNYPKKDDAPVRLILEAFYGRYKSLIKPAICCSQS